MESGNSDAVSDSLKPLEPKLKTVEQAILDTESYFGVGKLVDRILLERSVFKNASVNMGNQGMFRVSEEFLGGRNEIVQLLTGHEIGHLLDMKLGLTGNDRTPLSQLFAQLSQSESGRDFLAELSEGRFLSDTPGIIPTNGHADTAAHEMFASLISSIRSSDLMTRLTVQTEEFREHYRELVNCLNVELQKNPNEYQTANSPLAVRVKQVAEALNTQQGVR